MRLAGLPALGLFMMITARPAIAEPTCLTMAECAKQCDGGDTKVCDWMRARLAKLCDDKVAGACAALGDLYWEGYLSTTKDLARGTALHRKACELGDGGGCNQWAFALAYGHGVQRDDARAVATWQRGCELGHPLSCGTYGGRLRVGRGVARDDELAGKILVKACDLEDPTGCSQLGHWHRQQDRRLEARAAWRRACAKGNSDACAMAAEPGDAPAGDARDDAAQHAEHVRRCDGGEPASCARAAADYRHGIGVKANAQIADALDLRNCEAGYPPSCAILADQHAGKGELAEADRYATRACDLGVSAACGQAGVMRHKLGKGHDRRTALAMSQLGCKANDPPSCLGVGTLLEAGAGAPRSKPKARAAYARACDGRLPVACVAAARLSLGAKAAEFRDKACKLGDQASCAGTAAAPR